MNTASEEMIRNFDELKRNGITDFICSTSTSKKSYKPVIRKSAAAVSRYANAMYSKYGDDVAVEVGYFDNNLTYHVYCTYQA